MPKRKAEETKEERWQRKLKKYESKIQRKKLSRRVIYSSEDEEHDVQAEEHLEPMESDYIEVDMLSGNPGVPNEENLISTNNSESPVVENSDYDISLLQSLGEAEVEPEEFADNIHSDLASRYQNILVNGLSKESKEELCKKYLCPSNLTFARAPAVNPEIETMLVEACRIRDKRLLLKQEQLGRALSGLSKGITGLLKRHANIPEVIQTLNDVGKLLADSHYAETETRRSVIIPLIEKSLSDTFRNRKRDKFLFGENLGDAVKNSRGIAKTSQLIQASTSTTNLNYRGPPSRTRQQWTSQSYPPNRAGGRRPSYGVRRRAGANVPASGPLPPPARRAPPPPPPPPARRQPAPRQRQQAPDRLR